MCKITTVFKICFKVIVINVCFHRRCEWRLPKAFAINIRTRWCKFPNIAKLDRVGNPFNKLWVLPPGRFVNFWFYIIYLSLRELLPILLNNCTNQSHSVWLKKLFFLLASSVCCKSAEQLYISMQWHLASQGIPKCQMSLNFNGSSCKRKNKIKFLPPKKIKLIIMFIDKKYFINCTYFLHQNRNRSADRQRFV